LGNGEGKGPEALGLGRTNRRMAFTNYLMQSVIFGWVFYGYGSACLASLV